MDKPVLFVVITCSIAAAGATYALAKPGGVRGAQSTMLRNTRERRVLAFRQTDR